MDGMDVLTSPSRGSNFPSRLQSHTSSLVVRTRKKVPHNLRALTRGSIETRPRVATIWTPVAVEICLPNTPKENH